MASRLFLLAVATARVGVSLAETLSGSNYLAPQTVCPAPCSMYFAGATDQSAMVCQKQASGVGTIQQNAALGMACYPAYGCGSDMITCLNQKWPAPAPNFTDAAAACADLQNLTSENPWSCGAEGRPACSHSTPNSPAGSWLLATADLWCGWGVRDCCGSGSKDSLFFAVTSEYDCCLKAMQYEINPYSNGGAPISFQLNNGECRVLLETYILGNLDSSSGLSVKYQNTRCGTGRMFYRQAAGAADAANLASAGRCAVQGNFSRLSDSSSTNLPMGELPDGQELPNHPCTSPSDCEYVVRVNTINDLESCCKFCSNLTSLGQFGADASVGSDGLYVNPCVAFQIVRGRCHITRKAKFGSSIESSIRSSYLGGGCQSAEACNYYSSIFYREVSQVTPANASSGAAAFRKISAISAAVNNSQAAGTVSLVIEADISSMPSRRDMRNQLFNASSGTAAGTDCGKIEVFLADKVLTNGTGSYSLFQEGTPPLCSSACVSSGPLILNCSMPPSAMSSSAGRRLSEDSNLAVSFSSVGSGYDTVDFAVKSVTSSASPSSQSAQSNTSSTRTTSTTKSVPVPVASASGVVQGCAPVFAVLVSSLLWQV